MTTIATNLQELFAFQEMTPEEVDALTSGEAFAKMKEDLGKGAKSFVLQKMIPELLTRLDEMLDLDVGVILTSAWTRYGELASFAANQEGDEPETVALATHTITSHHEPRLDLEIQGGKTVASITLTIELALTIEGAVLTFEKGKLTEAAPGSCKVGGTISYQGQPLLVKASEPLQLPEKWTFGEGLTLSETAEST